MSDDESLSLSVARQIDRVCDRFEAAFKSRTAPRIEAYLEEGTDGAHPALFRALLALDLELRRTGGEKPSISEYVERFPERAPQIAAVFAAAPTRTSRCRRRQEIDRSLLLGILALQNNFIGRDELLAVFNTWVGDASQSFSAILAARGTVSHERLRLLEGLAREHIEQHGGDLGASLADASAHAPSYEFLGAINDSDFQASLGPVRSDPPQSAGHPPDVPTATWTSSERAASEGGRFRVVRFHRGGGLGDIYIAEDLELSRLVALKEIKPVLADEPDKRSRFVFEAEITGGLEHPSIVPVYGRGQYDNGRPFYAMRLIRGDNLHDAIARFHRADLVDRDPTERALALRELLGRFLDICDAIDYAHHRGVLHRDLKPGNVLLGRFGETLVGDWGLARLIDRVEEAAAEDAEPTLRPASASGTGQTLGGSAIGTVGYMPPEQAEGRLDQLGPASDVYSLGAILYALLTGQASVRSGVDRDEAIAEIVAGVFPRPRAVNPRVPPALEAVCLKAMARTQSDRYATPHALADEIKHWLADEPVSAYREPWTQRLARWSRRHRTWAQAAAISLVAVALVSAIAAVTVERAYRNERQAHAQSEADFQTAHASALASYKLASRDLASLANSEIIRERLARQVVQSYDDLLKTRPRDRKLRREAARADREVANLRRLLGDLPPAKASYDRAVAQLRRLVAESPNDNETRDTLALCLSDLSALERISGRLDDALALAGEALNLARTLRASTPDDLRTLRTEAFALGTQAAAQFDLGRYDEALRSSEQALKLWSAVAASPRSIAATDPVNAILAEAQVGAALRELGDASGSRKAYMQALAAAVDRVAKYPGNADSLATLAGVRNGLGELLLDAEPSRAEALFQDSIKDLGRVVRSHLSVPAFRRDLATAHNGLSGQRLTARQFDLASTSSSEASKILHTLLNERDLPGYHYSLGRVLANQARIARARGKSDQSGVLYTEAIKEHERALAVNPKSALDLKHRLRLPR